ncbi:hypothetical protein ILUMI_05795, partial [Ignelater luminosus]
AMTNTIEKEATNQRSFKGTLNVHQVTVTLTMRSFSCFCNSETCKHFKIGTITYDPKPKWRVDDVFTESESENDVDLAEILCKALDDEMHSMELISRVKAHIKKDFSYREVGKKYSLATSTIAKIYKTNYMREKKKRGVRKKLQGRLESRIRREVRRLSKKGQLTMDMRYTKVPKIIVLSKKHKERRLTMAKRWLEMGEPIWTKTVFTDKKRFCKDGPDNEFSYVEEGGKGVWNRSKRQSKGEGVMVSGAITAKRGVACAVCSHNNLVQYGIMKNRFYAELKSKRNSHAKNCVYIDDEQYTLLINDVNNVKSSSTKVPTDYWILKRYAILTIDQKANLIFPVKESGSNILYYVSDGELLDDIHQTHITGGQERKDRMIKKLSNRYKNGYPEYPHLEHNVFKDAAFCFVCILFPVGIIRDNADPAWVVNGVRKWHKMKSGGIKKQRKLAQYFSSKTHKAAVQD